MGVPLCILSDVKAATGLPSNIDTVLTKLISDASDFIREYTNRVFGETVTHNEIRDGGGGTELFLRSGPASSIASVTIERQAIPVMPDDESANGYFLNDTGNILCLRGYTFTKGRKNVRVSYNEGSVTIPNDIARACAEIVVSAYLRGKRGPDLASEGGIGGQSFSFSKDALPAFAKLSLDRRSRVAPA